MTRISRPAGVASSVWDAGRMAKEAAGPAATTGAAAATTTPGAARQQPAAAAKRKRSAAVLDAAAVVIHSRPVPTRPNAQSEAYALVLERMSPGQGVDLEETHAKGLATYARKRGVRTTMRDNGNGTFGVWRLPPQAGAKAPGKGEEAAP